MTSSISDTSRDKTPFPLSAFIRLYVRSHKKDTYVEHFKGTKLLYEWLSPVVNDMQWEVNPIPPLCGSYELQELANICGVHQSIIFQEILSWTPPHQNK